MAAMAAVLLVLLVAAPAAYAANHVVGGSAGWSQSGDYSTWAAGETFTVGDTLVFNYGSSHSVDEVTQADYDNCNTGNAIQSHSGGKTTITLDKPGPLYFACPTSFHCSGGMKLGITVVAASSGGSPPATPGTTPSPPSGGNTSPDTPTPSTPATRTPAPPLAPRPNGATGYFGGMSWLMIVLGAGVAFVG